MWHHPTHPTRAIAVALTLGLAVSAAACGGDPDAADHNQADVSFAGDMLVHHSQALEMVDLTEGRDLDPQVREIADQIEAAQAPEIDTFTTWLTAWGQDVPDTSGDHAGHDTGSGEMPGMMSSDDMTALEDASDADFQEEWLTMMIEHHEGAVDMARTETQDGENQPAVDLAATIVASQTQEIDAMQALLP